MVPAEDRRPGQVRRPDPLVRLGAGRRPSGLHRRRVQEAEEGVRRHRLQLQTVSGSGTSYFGTG